MICGPKRAKLRAIRKPPARVSFLQFPKKGDAQMETQKIVARPGLGDAEAKTRLATEGPNELPQANRRTVWRIVRDVLREPMLALLLGGGVVYLALGDVKEAVILLVFACFSVLITVVQEARTERVLDALRDLTSPRALVIRGGVRKRIAGRDVVREDLIVLAEGDRVPADARLLSAQDLQADESLLTGESVPVRKIGTPDAPDAVARPGGDDLPFVYSGSLIVRGTGTAEVIATGPRSEIGKIGKSLGDLETAAPHLQTQIRKLVRIFAIVGAGVSLLVVALYGAVRGGWLDAILAGIAVGMSMLPEEFPVVLAVFMAMGAWRISRARVLTRRANAIEALGSTTVLCTDKTGTLTENRMTIVELRLADGSSASVDSVPGTLAPSFRNLVATGVLASAPEPFDPMEKAFHALAKNDVRESPDRDVEAGSLVKAYALTPDCLAMSHVWKSASDRNVFLVAAKGAPEAIAELCRLDPAARSDLTKSVDRMAAEGLRVLGVARATFADAALPDSQQGFDFAFVGLVGLSDPLRASVAAAIRECRTAGIRVVMITGDYPATARAVARAAGLDADDIVGGEQLAALSDAEVALRVKTATIFARIMPEQKLRIVEALKANGEVVAMTGDGVNDAPSLKAANIGIAMGGRGTDVAREAASIVLLDDDFGSIVATVRLGRRIYDNLRKAMSFIFAVHVPIAGLALLPLLFGLPILLGPMHIAFLEMVIDPVCSLVFEAEGEEDDVMSRRPRDPAEPLFSGAMIAWSVLQGALAFGLVAAIFVVALGQGMPVDEVRALSFLALVTAIVALILVNRSASASLLKAIRRPNRALAIVLPVVILMLAATLLVPSISDLFRFGPLHADDILLTVASGAVVLVGLELAKPMWRAASGRRRDAAPQVWPTARAP
jgi:Ca2+-transporting ATPase